MKKSFFQSGDITNHVKQPFASICGRLFYFASLRFVRCLCAIAEKQYKNKRTISKNEVIRFLCFCVQSEAFQESLPPPRPPVLQGEDICL